MPEFTFSCNLFNLDARVESDHPGQGVGGEAIQGLMPSGVCEVYLYRAIPVLFSSCSSFKL